MVVILFSMSCLKEKHQERMRQDATRRKEKGWAGGGDGGEKSDGETGTEQRS